MTTATSAYDQLTQSVGDPAKMLAIVADHFREVSAPHELFETLKLATRQKLGLPLLASDNDPAVGEELDRQMEMGLLDACREVGQMLMQQGRIAEGWMYLRPLGNLPLVAEMMTDIQPTEENTDDLVQVLLNEGVDIARGFALVIDSHGTCNSITTYEQTLASKSPAEQRPAATILLNHIYDELVDSVRADIEQREGQVPDSRDIMALMENRDWLFADSRYHIDTSHLSSALRFARVIEEPTLVRRAWELTQYGRKLNRQFHYPGEEPFADFYTSSDLYFSVLLGERVDEALSYFERKLRNVDMLEHGTGPIETYVELLNRLDRPGDALRAAVEYLPTEVPMARALPLLLELAEKSGDFETVQAFCRSRDDLLGYTAAMIAQPE